MTTLTVDQDADNAEERRRIETEGSVDEDGYINEEVQVSRSLGDFDAKFVTRLDADVNSDESDSDDDDEEVEEEEQTEDWMRHSLAVLPTPEVTEMSIDDLAVRYLLLACDGLFENQKNDKWIGKVVREGVTARKDLKQIAAQLVRTAIGVNGSEDNVCAVLVALPAS